MSPPEIKKIPEKAKAFAVFVDTNTIHTNEKDITLFPTAFKAWWAEIAKTQDVKLIIPELVFSELTQQKTKHYRDSYQRAIETLNSVNSAVGLTQESLETTALEEIKKKISATLWSQFKEIPSCSIEIIPYQDISAAQLKTMVESAIWRTPPFKNNREGEGFRDAIVLETLRVFREKNPHTDIVFITRDHMLELAARQISNKEKNLIILKEYSAAGEYINAARTKFTAEFLHKVIEKAGNILTPLEKSPFGEEVISYLTKTYSLNHGDIEYIAGEGLAAFYPLSFIFDGKPRFHLLDTDFVSVIGDNTFHWNTTIGIVGDYSQSGLTTVLETFKDIKKKVRVLIVQLEWEMKVTNDLKCDEFKILSYKLVHSYWKPAEEFYSKEPIQESKGSEQL